jgi:hypothetical protein
VQARNFAVMTGANAGISCVMRRIRGGEDIQGRWGFRISFCLAYRLKINNINT